MSAWNYTTNSTSSHYQNTLEQCCQYPKFKVYVCWCDDLFLKTPMECFHCICVMCVNQIHPMIIYWQLWPQTQKIKMNLCMWKLEKTCILVSWPIDRWRKDWQSMVVTKFHIYLVYESTTHNQSNSYWLLMTLASNVSTKRMQNIEQLLNASKCHYKVEIDWTGEKYCRITVIMNYKDRHVNIPIPGYIKKQLQKYEHIQKGPPQNSPHPAPAKKYGNDVQCPRSSRQHYQGTIQEQKETRPTGCWKHTLLCLGFQHHPPHGTQHFCCWKIQSLRIHNGHSWTTSWSLYNAPKCKSQV